MKDKDNTTTVIKSPDKEKLVVQMASSTEDEIRFYINKNQFIAGVENEDESITIKLESKDTGDISEVEEGKTKVKFSFRGIVEIALIILPIAAAMLVISLIFVKIFKSFIFYMLVMSLTTILISTGITVFSQYSLTSLKLKRKHAAEHMMANFLEKNKRLPKNVEEFKKASRFHKSCGSSYYIKGTPQDFISCIVAAILTFIINVVIRYFTENEIVELIVVFLSYYIICFVVRKILNATTKFDFLVQPIEDMFTKIVQIGNTCSKRKLREDDLALVYFVAYRWIQIVYPEFYNGEPDSIVNSYE